MKRVLPTRGTSLVELMIALTVLAFALAAATSLIIASGQLIRNGTQISESNDEARMAGEAISKQIEIAGLGAARGLWVNQLGIATKINAVIGWDGGLGGSDELWLVIPSVDALQPTYATGSVAAIAYGGAVTRTWTPAGLLFISDTTNLSIMAGPLQRLFMVSNLGSGSLITPLAITPSSPGNAGTVSFAESAMGLTDAPEKPNGGYQIGDLVYEVRVVRYFMGVNAQGRPSLMRAAQRVGWDARGIPFQDQAAPEVLQDGIEDFQVAFGFEDPAFPGNPSRYIFQNGLAAPFAPGLRAVRVNVVSLGKLPIRDGQNRVVVNATVGPAQVGVPLIVENHSPLFPPVPNAGFRRSLYRRRVETVNIAPSLL